MQQQFFTQTELIIILYRSTSLSTRQIADKLGITPHRVNDTNKTIHRKVKTIYPNGQITATMVLGIAVAMGEVTPTDLLVLYTSLQISLNKIP